MKVKNALPNLSSPTTSIKITENYTKTIVKSCLGCSMLRGRGITLRRVFVMGSCETEGVLSAHADEAPGELREWRLLCYRQESVLRKEIFPLTT